MPRRPKRSHNGGPPLDDYKGPPWGKGDPYIFLAWQAAHAKALKAPSRDVMLMRVDKAERLGLTYEEYTLELLERGRHLQEEDTERIAAIKAARKGKRFSAFD
ncbi:MULTISPECIES: hypothetical protein [unclassified Mesorhizobium]|uniref:hypothetical protein n=1 Tax=unclassified Mesorhizobium TaxID=325217 RepID=UPI0011293B86|nr:MULTISPECIES: hypothetical protein [unclassified Mesorhizobium]TPJ47699.1 hypothetical protein FJ437_09295 [Mesorhizobium sp. B2-6-6]MBZ9982995.1 hypothetical protein [Mesorhizobium sp. BR-1-1-8]MCA0001334.1 hypothetical protein [Mesorhizobium sp. B264B2A]MCA0004363.1 hypothetical protein [Mesorhizobium sp. B264B1B]MCA0020271.1 hypothetical protein [Mesorhizobium sp. B264B1A]